MSYLRGLPAYVINLDRSTERWAAVGTRIAQHVAQVVRVPAVDGRLLPSSAVQDFAAQGKRVCEQYPEMRIAPRVSANFWRGAMGCYLSHIRAIEAAASVHDRFLILEDDARFRLDLAAVTDDPPADTVNVWGGALVGGSYTGHARRVTAMRKAGQLDRNTWTTLPRTPEGVRSRCLATAVEMTSAVAETWVAALRAHPHISDVSWWFAMLRVPTSVPRTEVIYQDLTLGSERSAASHAAHLRMSARLAAEELI